jgi:predicted ATPase
MISHIRVKNFRSLNDVSLSLGPRNFVVGPNMAGKSNLISLFRFLRQMVVSSPGAYGLPNAINTNGGFAELAWRGSESNLISLSLEGTLEGTKSENKESGWRYSIEILGDRSKGSIMVQSESMTISSDSGDIALVQKDATTGQRALINKSGQVIARVAEPTRSALEYELPDWDGNSLRSYFASFCFYQLIPQLMKQVNPVTAPRFLEESGGNLSSWLMMIQTRFPEAFARIVSAVKDVLPGVANVMTWPTPQSTVFIASTEKSLRTPVPVWQMSDGELTFLALLSLIFSPEEFGAPLFCVEELENHLHPRLIDALIKLHNQRRQELNGNAGQVIVTTHSPQVVDKVGLDELIIVSKRNGESVFTRPGDKPQLRKLLEDGEIGLGDLVYSGALGEE